MADERLYERPDARHRDPAGMPAWATTARLWSLIAGVSAALVAIPIIFFAPGLYVGDMSILIGMGWISAPAALVFGPAIGWLVWRLLAIIIRRELRQMRPNVERITWTIICSFLGPLIMGIVVMIKVSMTPSVRWVP
jgi:hypothetical protein